MAKITGPLLSKTASGKIGERLTFSQRKSGQQARFQKAQKRILPSNFQADNQGLYRTAFYRWATFSANQKAVYENLVKSRKLKMSGWNYFCGLAIQNPLQYLGLVSYLNFNYISSGKFLDQSGNNNDATLKPTYPSNCPTLVAGKNKTLLKAANFDGNDYATQPAKLGSAGTIEFWLNPITTPSIDRHYFSSRDVVSPFRYFTLEGYITSSRWGWGINGVDKRVSIPISQYPAGWFHVAFTWDTATGLSILYWNGIFKGQTTGLTSVYSMVYPPDMMAFNAQGSHGIFGKGKMDEFRIYNRALPVAEILKTYKCENK